MNDETLLDPNNTPHNAPVKRYNNIPLAIGFGFLALIIFGFMWMTITRGDKAAQLQAELDRKKLENLNPSMANAVLQGRDKNGLIDGDKPVQVKLKYEEPKGDSQEATITVQENKLELPDDKPPELTDAEKEAIRIAKFKQDRFESAVNASTGVGGKKLGALNGGANNPFGASNPLASAQNALSGIQRQRQQQIDELKRTMQLAKAQQGAAGVGLPSLPDPNGQSNKLAFLNQKVAQTPYLNSMRTAPLSELEIKTGTTIPSLLVTQINSDLPGMVIAQVSENVYDTATGKYLLIPQGSRLIGQYDSKIAFGQNRALMIWTRLIYPDASTIELGGMQGADHMGQSGVADLVNNHYLKTFGAALLTSIIGAGTIIATDDKNIDEDSARGKAIEATARELNNVSIKIINKHLDVQPTITIRAGARLNVMVNKDIIFPKVWATR